MKTKPSILPTFILISCITVSLRAAELPGRVLLWPKGAAPGSELTPKQSGDENVRVTDGGDRVVSNVHQPCIFPYLPSPDAATGAAVIIAPGGGHRELWSTHEGHNLAEWFSERGVAAFVLHNRLAREKDSPYTVDEHALADTQRAIQLVRSRAEEWNLNAARVGVMGFSAGGELAALADMRFIGGDLQAADPVNRQDSKPSFVGLIYPGSSRRFEVAENAAPVFIVCGYDDRPDISEGMATLYLKYKKAHVPAELHIYANAGHGFGLRASMKGAVAGWPERYLEWLQDMGMLNSED